MGRHRQVGSLLVGAMVASVLAVSIIDGSTAAASAASATPPLAFGPGSGIDGDLGLPGRLEGHLRLDINVPTGPMPVTSIDVTLPSSMRFESVVVRRIVRSGTTCDFSGQRLTYRGSRTLRLSGFTCVDGADADDLAQFAIDLEEVVIDPGSRARVGESNVQASVSAGRLRWTARGDGVIAIEPLEAGAHFVDGGPIDGVVGRSSAAGARTTLEGQTSVEVRQRTPKGAPIVSATVDLPAGMTFARIVPVLRPLDGDRCDTRRLKVQASGRRSATITGFSCSDRPGGDGTVAVVLSLRDVVVRTQASTARFDDLTVTYRVKDRTTWRVEGHGVLRTRSTAGPAPRLVDVRASVPGPVGLGGEALLRYEAEDPGRLSAVTMTLETERGRRFEVSAESPAGSGTIHVPASESAEVVAVTLTADDGLRSATYHADGSVTTDPVGLSAPASHDVDLGGATVEVDRRMPLLDGVERRSPAVGGVGTLIDIGVDASDPRGIGRVELLYGRPGGPYRWITAGPVRRCITPSGEVGGPGCQWQDVWEPVVRARVDAMWEPGSYRLDRIVVVAADGVRRASYLRDGEIKRASGLVGPVHHDLDLRRLDFVLVDDGRFDTAPPRLDSLTWERRGPFRVGDEIRIRASATDASGVSSVWLLYESPSGEFQQVYTRGGTHGSGWTAVETVGTDWEPGRYRLVRATVNVGDRVQWTAYGRDGALSTSPEVAFGGTHHLDLTAFDFVVERDTVAPGPPDGPEPPVLRSIRVVSTEALGPNDTYRVEFDAHAPTGVSSVTLYLDGPGGTIIVTGVGDERCDDAGCIETDPWFAEEVVPPTRLAGRYRIRHVSVRDWNGNETTYLPSGDVRWDRTYLQDCGPVWPLIVTRARAHGHDLAALGMRITNPEPERIGRSELRHIAAITAGPYATGDVVAFALEVQAEHGVQGVDLHFQGPDAEEHVVSVSGWRCDGELCELESPTRLEFEVTDDWPRGEYRLIAVRVHGVRDRLAAYHRSGDDGPQGDGTSEPHGFDLSAFDFEVR